MPNAVPTMRVIHAVHLQPKCYSVMKPPTTGPATGPTNVAPVNTDIATPLSSGPQKSTKVPLTTVNGDEPKDPEEKRHSIIVSRFCATATGIWKMQKMLNP